METSNPSAADVTKALGGIDFPADRSQLIKHARSNDADARIIHFLEQIPDKQYDQPTEIEHQLSEYASDESDSDRQAA